MVFAGQPSPPDEDGERTSAASTRRLKRWRQRAIGLLPGATQQHVKGVRGSVTELPEGTIETGAARMQLSGPRARVWDDHAEFGLWFQGKAQPSHLRAQMQRLLPSGRQMNDLSARIRRHDQGLAVAEEYAEQALNTKVGQRMPIIRLVKRRLVDRERAPPIRRRAR